MRTKGIKLALLAPLIGLSLNAFSSINPSHLNFQPITDPVVNIPINENGAVKYLLTNNGNKAYHLQLSPSQGLIQETGKSKQCGSDIYLLPGKSCVLSFVVDGSEAISIAKQGPVLCEKGWQWSEEAGFDAKACVQPKLDERISVNFVSSSQVTLSIKVNAAESTSHNNYMKQCFASMAGCVITLIQNGSTQKSISLTNTSQVTGKNIQAYGLPTGVTQDASACTSLKPSKSCTIYFKAGNTRTLSKSVTIKGSNTASSSITMQVLGVGDSYSGGIIACLGGGLQNLIMASSDNSTSIEWGTPDIRTFGNSATDGQANTTKIVNVLGNNFGKPYGAQLCNNYEVDSAGNSPCTTGTCYSNWFMPANVQIDCLYANRALLAPFPVGNYWTSSEVPGEQSWGLYAYLLLKSNQGVLVEKFKDNLESVLCVSSFTP